MRGQLFNAWLNPGMLTGKMRLEFPSGIHNRLRQLVNEIEETALHGADNNERTTLGSVVRHDFPNSRSRNFEKPGRSCELRPTFRGQTSCLVQNAARQFGIEPGNLCCWNSRRIKEINDRTTRRRCDLCGRGIGAGDRVVSQFASIGLKGSRRLCTYRDSARPEAA